MLFQVLEHGRIAEIDTPDNLLKDKNSIFCALMLEKRDDKPR